MRQSIPRKALISLLKVCDEVECGVDGGVINNERARFGRAHASGEKGARVIAIQLVEETFMVDRLLKKCSQYCGDLRFDKISRTP